MGRLFLSGEPYLETIALDTVHFASDSAYNMKWSLESLTQMIQQWPAIIDSSAIIDSFYSASSGASYAQLMQVQNRMQKDSNTNNLKFYQEMNAVSPVDINEQNLQTVNRLYMNYFLSIPDSFYQTGNLMSVADQSTLYYVASQCYLKGGPAVLLARSMYWTAMRDNSIQFWDDCSTDKMDHAQRPKSATQDSVYLFKVYPNPIDKENSLNVQCIEAGDITFYNVLGEITFKAYLRKGVNTFNCDQLSCEDNVILYMATMQSGKIETGKVVTLK